MKGFIFTWIFRIITLFIKIWIKWLFWGKFMWKWSLSLHHSPPLKEITHSRLSCLCITYSIRMGNLGKCKCQKQPLEVFCEKSCLKNFAKFTGKHLFFNKVAGLRPNNSGRLLLKCGHCISEAREIDCLCCREVDAMLIASAKIPERKGGISPSSFYGHLPDLVTC